MKSIKSLLIVLISFSVACNSVSENKIEVVSPDGNIQINFELTIEGVPTYTVSHKKSEVIKSSKLGFLVTGILVEKTFSSPPPCPEHTGRQ